MKMLHTLPWLMSTRLHYWYPPMTKVQNYHVSAIMMAHAIGRLTTVA